MRWVCLLPRWRRSGTAPLRRRIPHPDGGAESPSWKVRASVQPGRRPCGAREAIRPRASAASSRADSRLVEVCFDRTDTNDTFGSDGDAKTCESEGARGGELERYAAVHSHDRLVRG